MPEPFDPYYEWLGIPAGDRPPDHYTLLDIERLGSDTQRIAHAADVRMAKVRKIRPGTHPAEWGRLLDQLRAAKVCLLNPVSKAAYDASITTAASCRSQATSVPDPAGEFPRRLATPAAPCAPAARNRKSGNLLAVGVLLFALVGLGGAFYHFVLRQPAMPAAEDARADRPDPEATPASPGVSKPSGPTPSKTFSGAQAALQRQPRSEHPVAERFVSAQLPLGQPTGPEPRPAPHVDPPPPQQPGPAQPPDPQAGNPSSPVDIEKQAAFCQAIADVRSSMSGRDPSAARKHLETAASSAQTAAERAQVARLGTMLDHLDEFWKAMRESISRLDAASELVVKNTRVAVVESSRNHLTVKAAGRIRTWPVASIPTALVMAVAEESFRKDAAWKAVLGTFLAVDADGDRQYARQLWREAAAEGMDVEGLMPELDLAPGGVAKIAPPTDQARLKRAKQSVQETFRTQYAGATTNVKRLELARALLARAPAGGTDADARFVMFREARDLAVTSGEPALACEAVDQMAKSFTIDAVEMKTAALEQIGKKARGLSSQREIVLRALELFEQAIEAKQLDEAERAARLAMAAARKSRSTSLVRQAAGAGRRVQALRSQGGRKP